MTCLPFQSTDPARSDFQFLEDLATAYWYSEVLFTALEMKLFDHMADDGRELADLAGLIDCKPQALRRLLAVLRRLDLVGSAGGIWYNHQLARRFLVSDQPDYLGHFLLYRRYMKTGWEGMGRKLTGPAPAASAALSEADDYEQRNCQYVRAMDVLARQKADDIVRQIPAASWRAPLLDVGGGAGALSRALIQSNPDRHAYLLELPEVIRASRKIYPRREDWQRMQPIAADFRSHPFGPGRPFGMVLMGNFLHAYGACEARGLIEKALSLLAPEGLLVVHDYFPDRISGASPHKGALYDLCMMLHTYDGRCHDAETITGWLRDNEMADIRHIDLSTDSSLILAARHQGRLDGVGSENWAAEAQKLGFHNACEMPVHRIVLAAWPAVKCRFGCACHGQNLQCPPNGMEMEQTRVLLQGYCRALLVEGAPPGEAFHRRLLALERQAFLAGYHKALAFGAGPCPVCRACPDGGPCLQPEKARPSMEGAGMDVYATARNARVAMAPVAQKGDYVKYIGLLLLE